MSQHFDVIVVGAGMVGSTLAVALAQDSDLQIALIEPHPHQTLHATDPADLRVSAINPASEHIFKNINIWPHFMAERLSPFQKMTVWETEPATVHFDSADIGAPHLGHLIENRHIQQACLSQCQQHRNIHLFCPDKPLKKTANQLELTSGQHISADLIVAADGAQSPLREWAQIPFTGTDYQQQGLVCTITTEYPHQATARQRFFSEGPLALLPLADPHQCSIVWSNSVEETACLQQIDDDAFKTILADATEHCLGDIVAVSARASFPLKRRHAQQYIEPGFALVGDAAHTIHPLAGQGVNIGLLDAATLAEVVLAARQKGKAIGSKNTLSQYQRRRMGDNKAIQMTMDAFHYTFGSENPLLRTLRRCGFHHIERNAFLKNLLIQQASGQRFANPTLTQAQLNR